MARQSGRPAQLGTDDVIRFADTDHFLRELAGNLGRGRAFVRTRREFQLQEAVTVQVEAPGVRWKVRAEAVVVFARDGFVGLEFENFEQSVLPELDRLGQDAEQSKMIVVPSERTVIAPMPTFEATGRPRRTGAAEVHITDEDDRAREESGRIHMRPMPSIPDPFRTEADEPLRRVVDRNSTVVEDPPTDLPLDDTGDLPDGTQDLGLYERHVRTRRPRNIDEPRVLGPRTIDVDDSDATHDGTPYELVVPEMAIRDPSDDLIDDLVVPVPPHLQDLPEDSHARERDEDTDSSLDIGPVLGHGLEVFEDRSRPFLRSTPGGVLKLHDDGDLLGLYLAQLRHGILMVVGGPQGAVGDSVRIKVAAARVVSVDAKVLARAGDLVTLEIADASPIRELLQDRKDAIWGVVSAIVGEARRLAPPVIVAPPSTPTPAPVLEIAVPLIEVETHPSPPPPDLELDEILVVPDLILPPDEPEQSEPAEVRAEAAPEPELMDEALTHDLPPPRHQHVQPTMELPAPPEPIPVSDGPAVPKTPKLIGNAVRFETAGDLAHELKINLTNGGLFVESGPLPLRSKKRMTLAIGDTDLDCAFEGEVVFADGGRVGFMVTHASEVVAKLQQIMNVGEATPHQSVEEEGSIDIAEQSLAAAKELVVEPVGPIKGKLDAPLTMGRIFDLQFRRIDNESELAESTMLQLVEFLVRKEMRGVLDVETDEKKKLSLWLHQGSVAFVSLRPTDETHALGRILINLKRLNDGGLRQGLDSAQKTKKSLGRTLVSLGLVKKVDISAALREQARLLLDTAFNFKSGRFEWVAWREPPGEADLVLTKGTSVLAHHLRHRYEALGSAELEVLFGKNMGRRAIPVDDLDRIAGPMALQQKELRFLQLQVDGTRTISDAVLGSPIGRLASLRLVGVLLSLGMLRFTDGQQHVARENTSMGREPSAFVRIKKEMRDRLSLLREMNHFEILGVHWSAHHRSHRTAYDKMKREFDLKRSPLREAPEDVRSIGKEINALIDTAWTTLSNAETRQAYRKQMFDKTERQYASDMLVKQGEVALMRGDRVAAIESLETAVELDPSNRNKTLLATAREGRR